MKLNNVFYILHSGKNSKPAYFIAAYARLAVPRIFLRKWRKGLLKRAAKRADYAQIKERADYYNRLTASLSCANSQHNDLFVEIGRQKMTSSKVYYLDAMAVGRWFPQHLCWRLLPGDITTVPSVPSIVKSRPIVSATEGANSVLLCLNKVRHFIFVNDNKSFAQKKDMVVFRGKVNGKEKRVRFMEKWYGNARIDAGSIDMVKPEWLRPKMTIAQQLDYRYIMAIEGNDVASNLKWIMSSNSVAVMPRPQYETWFMEGTLVPGVHYIEVRPDFSDLVEKIDYYSAHPAEAEAIVEAAHRYVARFRDSRRERIIALMVMDKYLRAVNNRDWQ